MHKPSSLAAIEKSNRVGDIIDKLRAGPGGGSAIDKLAAEDEGQRLADALAQLSTAEIHLVRLRTRAARLAKLLAMTVPPLIVAREVFMVLDAVEGAYPNEVGEIAAERARMHAKRRVGRCAEDACEAAAGTSGYCNDHLAALSTLTSEIGR